MGAKSKKKESTLLKNRLIRLCVDSNYSEKNKEIVGCGFVAVIDGKVAHKKVEL